MCPFRNENIELLKSLKGWSYSHMAAVSGVPLRRLENIRAGYTDFSEDDARCIATAAGFPLNFFVIKFNGASVSDLTFRTTTRTPKKVVNRLSAEYALLSTTVNRLVGREKLPTIADGLAESLAPDYDPDQDNSSYYSRGIEQIAVYTREMLGESSSGPIDNVTWTLEKAGFFTAPLLAMSEPRDDDSRYSDGVTHPGAGAQVIGFAQQEFGDRQRMTLAHELGHLILQRKRAPQSRVAKENEAFLFAGAFLMPKADAERVLDPLMNLVDYRALKAEWGIAISGLIMRARKLGIIDMDRARSLMVQLSARGWRKREPVHVELERPVALKQILGAQFGAVESAEKSEVYSQDASNFTGVPFSMLEYWANGLERKAVSTELSDVRSF